MKRAITSLPLPAALLVLLFAAVHLPTGYAQEEKSNLLKDRADDAFRELSDDKLTLRFINALNGNYVPGAKITIDDKTYVTDQEGAVYFQTDVTNGTVPVRFEKDGFIPGTFKMEIMVGTLFWNRVSVSPDLRPNTLRIVLDWSEKPRDLDAHLVKENAYHISYRNQKTVEDGAAQLDRDDTNGEGPETITLNQVDQSGTYLYSVADYTNRRNKNSTDLTEKSRAVVRVFGDNELKYSFHVTRSGEGNIWHVFMMKNGYIQPVQRIE